MIKLEHSELPERLQERGLDVLVTDARELSDDYVQQLVDKSRQDHIVEFEGHEDIGTPEAPGRFRDVASYREWADGKQRVFYMLINDALRPDGLEVPDIGGVIWFGKRENEHAPGRALTFAIRNYARDESRGWGQYVGTGLGTPFMQATHRDLLNWYQDEKIWLDLVEGNDPAYNLYSKNGYFELDRLNDEAHGGQRRIVMANDTALFGVSSEIQTAFYPQGVENIQRVGGGMVNATLKVEVKDQKQILQKLSPIFGPKLLDDYQVVAEHLKSDGWEMAGLIKTADGSLYQTDADGSIWRAFEYIESDHSDQVEGGESFKNYGEILGRLHRSLAKLDYEPRHKLPHFHDTEFYADELFKAIPKLSQSGMELAYDLLRVYHTELGSLPRASHQLIHGDPRTNNMLYRDGKPFTFIDWDTLMKGTIWVDIGDMLRSIGEDALKNGKPVPLEDMNQLIEGYRQTYCPDEDPVKFRKTALLAGQTIALELAMRFVADYQDGAKGYFDWDADTYKSRHEHNMVRAKAQYTIFDALKSEIQETK